MELSRDDLPEEEAGSSSVSDFEGPEHVETDGDEEAEAGDPSTAHLIVHVTVCPSQHEYCV